MYFWEADELSIKDLFTNGWDVFLKDALGCRVLLIIIVPNIIISWLGLFSKVLVLPVFMFYCLLVPYMINQVLLSKNNYSNMITTFLKDFWSRFLFFLIAVMVVYGGTLLCLQWSVDYFASTYVPATNVDLISSALRAMTMSVISVPFFFMAFSVAIKNMGVLKAFCYSVVLVKRYWQKVFLIEAILVIPLLLPIFAPVLSSYVSEVIAVYLLMVLIIQFCNLDYLENRS
jgi:hypothetical protein